MSNNLSDILKSRILYGLFSLLVLFVIIDLLTIFVLGNSFFVINSLQITITVILFLLFAIRYLGFKKSIFFVVLSSFLGFVFEFIGTNYGSNFGIGYYYNDLNLGPKILSIPLMIPIFWSVFIFIAYCISNSFLLWSNRKINKFIVVLFLVLLDGIIVCSIDIFLDPLMVERGYWVWENPGVVFGIPVLNYLGWFLVTVLSSFIFRTYEFIYPGENKLESKLLLIPILWYICWCFYCFFVSFYYKLYMLGIIGFIVMFGIFFVNVLLYKSYKMHKLSKIF